MLEALFLYSFWTRKSLFVESDSSPAKLLLFSFLTQGSLLYGGALLLVAISSKADCDEISTDVSNGSRRVRLISMAFRCRNSDTRDLFANVLLALV